MLASTIPLSSAAVARVCKTPVIAGWLQSGYSTHRVTSNRYSRRSTTAHASASEGTSEPGATRAGILSNPEEHQSGFSVLAVLYTGVAAATTLAPVWSLVHLLNVSTVMLTANNLVAAAAAARGMLIVAGAYAWLMVACLVCLKDAAAHNRLGSDTYKRLMLGVLCQSIMAMLLWVRNTDLLTGRALMYPLALFLCTAVITGRVYVLTVGNFSLPDIARGFFGNIRQTLRPQTPVSAFYAACALLALVMFLWQFPAPGTPLFLMDCGPVAVLLKQARGAGMVLAGIVWYTLKDAAERGRLGASTFKQLNLAMALVAAVQLWGYWLISTDPAGVPMNKQLWNMLTGSGLLTLAVCDYHFFFAKK